MKLMIFPGGGNPSNETYRRVYDLLERRALSYGYDSVDISIRWPGHSEIEGVDPGSRLTLDGAIEVAHQKIKELEKQGTKFHIIGRSFGTIVAVKLAIDYEPEGLNKLILWGPPPYWVIREMFVQNITENAKKAEGKGLYLDETFFHSVVPLELMIKKLKYLTVIATGTKDIYSKPAYLQYLKKAFVKGSPSLNFRDPVKGVPHEVTEDLPEKAIAVYLIAFFL